MRIAIASDHAAVELKAELREYLIELGHEVADLGPETADRVDYPDYGYLLAAVIADGTAERGVALCGSGIGISIAVNRNPACRAALVSEPLSAALAREHNDANVLAMGAVLPFVYTPMPIEHLGLLGAMAAMGLIGGLLSIAAYRLAPAVIVAPMQYSQMLWAVFYGWLFFSESLDFNTALGSAVIIASGIYIVLREGTPAVSTNRPVLENRSRFDTGMQPRIGSWLRLVERRGSSE